MPVQLKASDSFMAIVSRMRKARALVLCEGSRDAEAIKAIARRLGLAERLEGVIVTDAEGVNRLRKDLLPVALALIIGKVVSRLVPVVLIVDANREKPEDRVRGFIGSLRSRNYEVAEPEPVCVNVWRIAVKRAGDELQLLIAVNGVFEGPFHGLEAHELEDHIAYLKLIEGLIAGEDLLKARKASDLVKLDEDFTLLDKASVDKIERAFSHITCILRILSAHVRI